MEDRIRFTVAEGQHLMQARAKVLTLSPNSGLENLELEKRPRVSRDSHSPCFSLWQSRSLRTGSKLENPEEFARLNPSLPFLAMSQRGRRLVLVLGWGANETKPPPPPGYACCGAGREGALPRLLPPGGLRSPGSRAYATGSPTTGRWRLAGPYISTLEIES
jgi:hypothetical protein